MRSSASWNAISSIDIGKYNLLSSVNKSLKLIRLVSYSQIKKLFDQRYMI